MSIYKKLITDDISWGSKARGKRENVFLETFFRVRIFPTIIFVSKRRNTNTVSVTRQKRSLLLETPFCICKGEKYSGNMCSR